MGTQLIKIKTFNNLILILFLLNSILCYSQIVKCEETTYGIEYGNKKYSTYHFVDAEYSMRSFLVFIVNDSIFQNIKSNIPKIVTQNPKQDFTDVYVLGISDFNKNLIEEEDEEIIKKYINQINKYRAFNNLSTIENREFINKHIIRYLIYQNDLCLYMKCGKFVFN